jgi:hypothetical protein
VSARRLTALFSAGALAFALPAAAPAGPAPAKASVTTVARAGFGGGARGFGRSPGFGSRYRGYRRPRSRGIFRRILRAIAIGYLLHLLFTTPGGLIVLLLLIVLIALAMRRMRRTLRY